MLELGRKYKSANTGGSVQIIERNDRGMTFERVYAPGTGRADPHVHHDFTQTWEAVAGEGLIEVEGDVRPLKAGERVELEPGTPHRDPYTPDSPFTVRGIVTPCPPFIEAYASAWAHHLQAGTVNKQDEMPLMQIFMLAKAYDGQSYRAGIPAALQRAALPVVVPLARLRGLRPSYDDV